MAFVEVLIGFLISLVVSGTIIYLTTRLFGENEGFGTAIFAALVGAILFTLVYYFIGIGWVAAIVSGIGWLIALQKLYQIGWLKALVIAIVIWIFATIVGFLLPNLTQLL